MKRPYQTGRWEPWERRIKITLRPIKNPVPMYVKQILVDIPEEGQWMGYDFEIGDWVAPYGRGAHADIELYSIKHYEDNINYSGELTIRFPGKGNGIQGCDFGENSHSRYKWPYEAPEEGYQPDWKWQHARITEKTFDARSKFIDESQKKMASFFACAANWMKGGGSLKRAMVVCSHA
jgi:hypothetical protein